MTSMVVVVVWPGAVAPFTIVNVKRISAAVAVVGTGTKLLAMRVRRLYHRSSTS